MGRLQQKTLHAPMNAESIRKVRGRIDRVSSKQSAAATLSDVHIADGPGNLRELYFIAAAAAAAGESLTVDVLKNGVSIFTAAYVYDDGEAANAATVVDLKSLLDDPDVAFDTGDIITIDRTYVGGGGPTPVGCNMVVVEFA